MGQVGPAVARSDATGRDPVSLARRVGQEIERYAAVHDRDGTFVDEGYAALRSARLPLLCVPVELGGWGGSLADAVRFHAELARWCASASLAFAMHTHVVLTHAWRWRRERGGNPRLLRAVAEDGIVVATSGASDFLRVSTRAVSTEEGWLVNGEKRLVSGAPGADWLVTVAVVDDPERRARLSFAVPFDRPGVEILDTWDALGMRGTGSHNVLLQDVRVSRDEGVAWPVGGVDGNPRAARSDGVASRVALVGLLHAAPVLAGVYWGAARAARDHAVRLVATTPRAASPAIRRAIGLMDAQIRTSWWSLEGLLRDLGDDPAPTERSYLDAMVAKRHVVVAAGEVTDLALEVLGGASYLRGLPLERAYRDVRAAKTHPLTPETTLAALGELACRQIAGPEGSEAS